MSFWYPPVIRKLNNRLEHADFWLFEFSVWLHVVAKSLVFVFIPVLLYRAGFSVNEIMVYYIIFHAIDVPLNFLVPPLIRRYGARIVFALSSVFAIGFFGILSFITPGDWFTLIGLAVCAALYDVMYWIAHLFLFIQSNKVDARTDRNTSILYSIKKTALVVGPAAGAGILIFAGDTTLLVVAIVLFICALVPLVKVDDFADIPDTPRWTFRQFFTHLRERKNYISAALFGIHRGVELIIWPLFIFVMLGSIESVALVPIILSATAIIFTYFSKQNTVEFRGAMITVGALLLSGVWMVRVYVQSELFIFFSIFLVGLFTLLVTIPLNADIFDRALRTDPLSAATYRNMASMAGKLVMFIFLAVIVNVFHVGFVTAFFALVILAGVNGMFLIYRHLTDDERVSARAHYSLDEH